MDNKISDTDTMRKLKSSDRLSIRDWDYHQ